MGKIYEKPVVTEVKGLTEGIFMTGSGVSKCKSRYMNGQFAVGTYNSINDGYKKGKGCEGCPANGGNACRFVTNPEQMNWDGDFRPSWEVQGKLPDEKGY